VISAGGASGKVVRVVMNATREPSGESAMSSIVPVSAGYLPEKSSEPHVVRRVIACARVRPGVMFTTKALAGGSRPELSSPKSGSSP
jgi:hypothetical protein